MRNYGRLYQSNSILFLYVHIKRGIMNHNQILQAPEQSNVDVKDFDYEDIKQDSAGSINLLLLY